MKPKDMRKSERISRLRSYYTENSQMVVNRDLVPWLCERSLDLYVEGWINSVSAPTVRLRRSMTENYLLSNLKPIICDDELIVGQPDFTPYTEEEKEKHSKNIWLYNSVIPRKMGRADHVALDNEKLLSVGVNGLIAEAKENLSLLDPYDGRNSETYEFYSCVITELEGVKILAKHYSECADALSKKAEGKRKKELEELSEILDKVPSNPASTFREALQSIHLFTFSLYGIYSVGRPDVYLLPYYENDIKNGIMTEAEAQELIDCFCLQYMNNMSAWAAAGFMIGGRDRNGKAVETALTWHFLTSISHTKTPDPNIGFCVTDEMGKEILEYASQIIKDGCGNPQIWNNDAVTRSMLKYGFDKYAANQFTHSTCVEITPIACSGVSITSPYINMLKIFLGTLKRVSDGISFEDLFAAYSHDFDEYCKDAMRNENLFQLERSRNTTDPVRISALINDCLKRGKSSENGGAIYNQIEPNMLGMTNTVESLSVIKCLVYDEKQITLAEFKKALECNYEGYEMLRRRIFKDKDIPHFGMGAESADSLAKRVSDMVLHTFEKHTSFRGADVIPGAFSYRDHEREGRSTAASPDGRLYGSPLAAASSPVQGCERLGPTVSLSSTAAWKPARFLGGTATNIKMNSNTPHEIIASFIGAFLQTDVAQLQFNIVNTETLIEAQKHPENYADLIVRIGGYSDYFVRIPRELQDEVISRG